MDYPRFVYKIPGPFQMAGGTYNRELVNGEVEMAKKLEDGWYGTLSEAINPTVKAEVVDDAPPTREELEAKATELGIKFDGRIGDKKLTVLIAQALEA